MTGWIYSERNRAVGVTRPVGAAACPRLCYVTLMSQQEAGGDKPLPLPKIHADIDVRVA